MVPEVERLGGEVIVVDNASDDESAAIARQYPTINLHIKPTRVIVRGLLIFVSSYLPKKLDV